MHGVHALQGHLSAPAATQTGLLQGKADKNVNDKLSDLIISVFFCIFNFISLCNIKTETNMYGFID